MKKPKIHEYNFNIKEEFSIYNNIGGKNFKYQTYSEWVTYVQDKYSIQKYTKTSLVNFLHYLIKLRNSNELKKDSWNNSQLPLITVALSMIISCIFTIMNIIHNFNINIATIYAGNLQDQFYDENFFADLLSETFSSDMKFFLFVIYLLLLLGIIIFSIFSDIISKNRQKYYFYSDYIEIITKILEQ